MKSPSSCLATTSTCRTRRQFSRPWWCGWGTTCKPASRTWACSSPTSDCPCCPPRWEHQGLTGNSASWSARPGHPAGTEQRSAARLWVGLEIFGIFPPFLFFFMINYISSLVLNIEEKKSPSASVITRLRITSKKCQSVPKAKCSNAGL